jgi:sugar/nucleoside kinase (ribokinase family)
MSRNNTEAVVVRDGAVGAYVFDRNAAPRHGPSYPTCSVYKIGSGDVFSATFAHSECIGNREVPVPNKIFDEIV